jgi:hypothetical protein
MPRRCQSRLEVVGNLGFAGAFDRDDDMEIVSPCVV